MSEIQIALIAMGYAVSFVLIGELLGRHAPLLRKVFMPGAILGGLLGLVLGPQVMDWADLSSTASLVYKQLEAFSGLFINGVFASLMLGRRIDGIALLWQRARPQIIMGHIYAWGQYVVGLCAFLFILAPLFNVESLCAATISIGFQGGHGTSAGLAESFAHLGFADGATIAFAVATFGIVTMAIGGPILTTLLTKHSSSSVETSQQSQRAVSREDKQPPLPSAFSPLTGQLSLHLALISIVIALGWALRRGAELAERAWRSGIAETDALFTASIPLFSCVLVVGIVVQVLLQWLGWDRFFRRAQFKFISAFSLDMVILGALATLNLATVGDYIWVIAVLCLAGIGWNVCIFFLLGPRVYPHPWYAYGMGDLAGGTATTASGLLLIRVADPNQQTNALRAYSEKQPLYEPFMGGGLVTASALPVLASAGPWTCLAITGGILAIWLYFALRLSAQ